MKDSVNRWKSHRSFVWRNGQEPNQSNNRSRSNQREPSSKKTQQTTEYPTPTPV
jgi:hypothetical protein